MQQAERNWKEKYIKAQDEIKRLKSQLAAETKRADNMKAYADALEMLIKESDTYGIENEVMSMARAQL